MSAATLLNPAPVALLNRMATWLEEKNVRWVAKRKAAYKRRSRKLGSRSSISGPIIAKSSMTRTGQRRSSPSPARSRRRFRTACANHAAPAPH